MKVSDTSDLWWKSAVIYCLDVETFLDGNGDGIGDLGGLATRLDYLAELGVTCLWLMPFYPSPDRDDGYDITDFYGVDHRLGHFGDFVEVIQIARDRGMRVIVDLVVNHTSDQHPWFKAARSSPDSPFRDFYVWRDEPPKNQPAPVFPDQETSDWQYDEKAGQYYQHVFYRQQPDLNITDERVRDEIAKVMGFWLQLGVSGFRVDAVPFLLQTDGIIDGARRLPDPHAYLRSLRSFLNRRAGEGILLGEVNLSRDEQNEFFGGAEGDELTMQFDFISMQNLYLSLAREDARPLAKALLLASDGLARHPVGELRPQPRRAHPRQADRGGARGGLRRVRPGGADAGLRPRTGPPAPADARRRPAAHPHGLQPALLPAGNPRALLRRGDRHGREPRRRRPHVGAHPDAVERRPQRRLLDGAEVSPEESRSPRAGSAPST